MSLSVQLPLFDPNAPSHGVGALPHIEVEIAAFGQTITLPALLDTGASVNVLPLGIGQQLGFRWEEQTVDIQLAGNLGNYPARAVAVNMTIPGLPPILQVFAWSQATHLPVILGQTNFFAEFDTCFFHSRRQVEIRQKS